MITQGADVLIIAAIDGTALAGQLQNAADQGIPVIAYDRLIRDSENVDFYVSFDNFEVGVAQAESLVEGLGEGGPFNIELFAGSLDDNNAHFFFDGAMSVLQPLIDDGTLVVKSDQTDIEQVATLRWLQETAQKRMEDLLTSTYNDGSQVDGVLSPYDGLSRGIITALQNAGYGPTTEGGAQPMPIVTGQDAEIASVKLIADSVQYSTIFKDTRLLAEQAVTAAEAFLNDEEPEANDTETTTTASRSSRRTCSRSRPSRPTTSSPPWSTRATGRPKRSSRARPTDLRTEVTAAGLGGGSSIRRRARSRTRALNRP